MDLPRVLSEEQAREKIAEDVLRRCTDGDDGMISNWHTERENARFYLKFGDKYQWLDVEGMKAHCAYFRELDKL